MVDMKTRDEEMRYTGEAMKSETIRDIMEQGRHSLEIEDHTV